MNVFSAFSECLLRQTDGRYNRYSVVETGATPHEAVMRVLEEVMRVLVGAKQVSSCGDMTCQWTVEIWCHHPEQLDCLMQSQRFKLGDRSAWPWGIKEEGQGLDLVDEGIERPVGGKLDVPERGA